MYSQFCRRLHIDHRAGCEVGQIRHWAFATDTIGSVTAVRVGAGETIADIDLIIEQPTLGERATVQVKSRAIQVVLNDHIEHFRSSGEKRTFFICHSPQGHFSVAARWLSIFGRERVSPIAIMSLLKCETSICMVGPMSDEYDACSGQQPDLFKDASDRALLDQLIKESRLYTTSKDYKELLDFVVQLRNFAPFNAMLLQVQKPGLTYAMSAREWLTFGRKPKDGARPLLILWPFGPVALVYDVQDTEGQSLPEDVWSFHARGSISAEQMIRFERKLAPRHIECIGVDAGDGSAGLIRVVHRARSEAEATRYRIHINKNHDTAVQFNTLAHELAHLCLGHLGADKKLRISARYVSEHSQRELEAESVAYIICCRNGVVPKSQTYLSSFVNSDTTSDDLDVYQIMRAAGQVEILLAMTAHDISSKSLS